MENAKTQNAQSATATSTSATHTNRRVTPTAMTQMRLPGNAMNVPMAMHCPAMVHALNVRCLIACSANRSKLAAVALKDMGL